MNLLNQKIESERNGEEGMGSGTQLGTHTSVRSLKAKFRRNVASFYDNPKDIIDEAGYGRYPNADGYDKLEQEAIDSR